MKTNLLFAGLITTLLLSSCATSRDASFTALKTSKLNTGLQLSVAQHQPENMASIKQDINFPSEIAQGEYVEARAKRHHAMPVVSKENVSLSIAISAALPEHFSVPAKQNMKRTPRGNSQAGKAKSGGKSQIVALLLCIFLGLLGIHRFYLGYIGIGILELLTVGVFGILTFIDLIRIITGDLKPIDGDYDDKFN